MSQRVDLPNPSSDRRSRQRESGFEVCLSHFAAGELLKPCPEKPPSPSRNRKTCTAKGDPGCRDWQNL